MSAGASISGGNYFPYIRHWRDLERRYIVDNETPRRFPELTLNNQARVIARMAYESLTKDPKK